MTNAHTPGPWAIDCNSLVIGGQVIATAGNLSPDTASPAEARANAALIAAAPDLLAEAEANARFLDQLAAHLEANGMPGQAGNCTIRAKATRAAIAKAEGRS